MKGSSRHGRSLAALAVIAGTTGLSLVAAAPAQAVAQTNACANSATADPSQINTDLVGSVPASVAPGATFTASGLKVDLALPGSIFVAGYNLGLLQNGATLPGDVRGTIEGLNTVEGTQNTSVATTSIGPVNISDPDGNPGTGDETADPAAVSVSFADMTWTAANSGQVRLREKNVPLAAGAGGLLINAKIGALNVQFRCSPGTVDAATKTSTFTEASPFATSQIVVPAAAPVAVDDNASVGANQATSINVVANDTDVNGDIDPGSVTIVDGPSSGTAVANPDGTVTYTNNAATAGDSFTYTVKDEGGLVSNKATVTVGILGDTCDASSAECSLDQVVQVQVNGSSMTMKQAGSLIELGAVTLNGKPQKTMGTINGLTVVNARGTDAGWSLTGQMTSDFSDGTGDGVCAVDQPGTWDNHCIPGGNVGWGPTASVAHTQIPGDVAKVDAGAPLPNGGLHEAHSLCSAADNQSGGTFDCGGAIGLGIPASAAAGLYKATLTLTLV